MSHQHNAHNKMLHNRKRSGQLAAMSKRPKLATVWMRLQKVRQALGN